MTTQAKNRRELFRDYMQNLTAGALPRDAVQKGLYVPSPGRTIADRLVPRLDLSPTASHLVVGGIGTGKTTELLRVENLLKSVPDVLGIYADVSLYHDLSQIRTGVLVVIAGLVLDNHLTAISKDGAAKERKQFKNWANGYTLWFEDNDHDDEGWEEEDPPSHRRVDVPGLLVPPEPQFIPVVAQQIEALQRLVKATREEAPHPVLLLDSLDRLSNSPAFEDIVIQDIRAIREAGIGTVVVGPLSVLFGAHRPTADRFDYVYQVPAVDVKGPEGLPFLQRVLSVRLPSKILPEACAAAVARFSGGILRDLISIARSAGEEAYVAGSPTIQIGHVNASADTFGRDLMLGLSQKQIEALQRVRVHGTFVQTSDDDISLLATRRVIEYGDTEKRYAVHPTIEPLLNQLAT